jgi:modification target Cys-rich repeat protein
MMCKGAVGSSNFLKEEVFMTKQKKIKKALIVIMTVLMAGFLSGGACEDKVNDASEAACGACPTLEGGGADFTGDARVDGLFRAIGTLKASTGSIRANFDAEIMTLGEVFGVDVSGMGTAAAVAAVKAAIEKDINAHVEGGVAGGLSVDFQKPKCTANAELAVEASADCQLDADCQISAECEAGEVNVKCEGQCSGSCEGGCDPGSIPQCTVALSASGECSGTCEGSCEVSGPQLTCEGECSGSCTVEAGMRCEGTCEGNCTGTCDGSTSEGAACAGKCEGQCDAACTIQGSGKCEGTCNGSCEYTPANGSCEGSCKGECKVDVEANATCEGGKAPSCKGSCSGSCEGSCEGNVTPPSCSAEGSCSAKADCEASASAQANASLECTPPSLAINYSLKANLEAGADASAAANFKARMEVFKKSMMSIAQGAYKMKALVTGDASLGIEAPVVTIGTQMKAVGQAFIRGDLNIDIPVFRITCATAAINGAAGALNGIKADVQATVKGQADMLTILKL